MEELQPLVPLAETPEENTDDGAEGIEATKPMPFGVLGIAFICALTQYAAFLGLTMLILMVIRIFGPK